MFPRTIEGHIIEEDFKGIFVRGLEKRRRMNRTGEDVWLLQDGKVVRDEDKIIAAQRIWKERVYSPPGTIFGPRGKMYRKIEKEWGTRMSLIVGNLWIPFHNNHPE